MSDKKIFQTKSTDSGNRIIEFVISDESVDRDNEIIRASGCDFSEFEKNPQFLGFHNSYNFPVGIPKSWAIDERNKQVIMRVYFPTVEELATQPELAPEHAKEIDMIYNMYKMRMLSAVSVGFIAKDWQYEDERRVITKWQLIEVSAVPIPSNPNALQRMMKSYEEFKTMTEKEEKAGKKISAETKAAFDEFHKCFTEAHKIMGDACGKIKDFMDKGAGEPNVGEEIGTDVNEPQPEKAYFDLD